MSAKIAGKIAKAEALRQHAGDNAARAKDRVARIERGEDVKGGLGKPLDPNKVLRDLGFTKADIDQCVQSAAIDRLGMFDDLITEMQRRRELSEKAAHRAIWRRVRDAIEA